MKEIPEGDWKKLRTLKTRAMNEACSRFNDFTLCVNGRDFFGSMARGEDFAFSGIDLLVRFARPKILLSIVTGIVCFALAVIVKLTN